MRFCTLLLLAACLLTLRPSVPLPAQTKAANPDSLAEYRFRKMHLMRPDLVVYPFGKIGRSC